MKETTRLSTHDLHCHSTASDGKLSPTELVNMAAQKDVKTLALTDHDTTNGLQEASAAADKVNINLIPGIELSTTWSDKCFHVVGLNIDAENPRLKKGVKGLQAKRLKRADLIADKLAEKGIGGAIADSVKAIAGDGMITRAHFAEYLVEHGYGSTVKDIFKHFLVSGKPGFVATRWAELDEAISWITDAGGVAVLAHPIRYKLSGRQMQRLLTAFKAVGGAGIEVICGNNSLEDTRKSANLARQYQLAGSVGSDFHSPNKSWAMLGKLPPLPEDIEPIWSHWC